MTVGRPPSGFLRSCWWRTGSTGPSPGRRSSDEAWPTP